MKEICVDYVKYITKNGKDIFKIVKTKTNRYYLVEIETGRVLANTKRQIIKEIIKNEYNIK